VESRTDLPQRIPQTLDVMPFDPPPVDLLIQLATALDEWDPASVTDCRPNRGPVTDGGFGRPNQLEMPMHNAFAPNAADLRTKVAFRKATASNPSGNCVHVAELEDGNVAIRHSDPTGPAIIFTPGEWDAFEDGVRRGEFSRA